MRFGVHLVRVVLVGVQVRHPQRSKAGTAGKLVEYQSVGRDTTEKKLAEEALRESEARLHAVVQGSPIPQFVIGRDHRVVYWNSAVEELTGIRASEIIGTNRHWSAFYPRERPVVADFLVDGSLGDIPRYYDGKVTPSKLIEGAFEATDFFPALGEAGKWLSYTAAPIRDAHGEIIGAIETLEDITERMGAESALLESEEKYRDLVEVASVGITIIQDGALKYANPSLAGLWGGPVGDLLAIPMVDLVHPDEREKVVNRMKRRLAGEQLVPVYETVLLRRDGSAYPAEVNAALITYQGRPADLILIHDISERKQAEEAVRHAEEKFRNIVEFAVEGIYQINPKGRFLTANTSLARILGYDSVEDLLSTITDTARQLWVHQEQRAEYLRRLKEHGTIEDFECEYFRKDGSRIWVSLNTRAVKGAGGAVAYSEGTVEDITQRKLAEEAKRQAEEKFRNIVEFAVEGIYQIDTKGRILTANSSMARALGYASVEDLLSTITDTARQLWVHQKERQEYLRRLKEHGTIEGFEAEFLRKNGETIWVSLNTRAVKGKGGGIVYSEGTLEDITQRKVAEQALRESEEIFRNPVEQSPVGVFLIQDGIARYVNPKLAEMAGYSREEMLNHPFDAMILADDRPKVNEAMARLLSGGAPSENIEYRGVRKDGTVADLEAYGSAMLLHGRPALYGTIIDVTERKKMADQIGESLKEKEVLLREIHHRVKNNMQVISSLLSVQSQNIKDEGIRGLFKESQNRIRSIALVHELLYRSDNLDQIEYGAYLKKMFIPLFESYSVDQRKVSIAIEAPKVMISIDKAVPCSLIVNELLSNSLKHAFPGDRKGTISIRFGLDAGKEEYTLDYGDNGVGLPPGLDIKTLNTLGMRLITGLTKQLGGTAEVQCTEGTHFRITFPAGTLKGHGNES